MERGAVSPEKQISRAVIAVYKDHLGRGPTSSHVEITARSVVTILEGSLTKAERTLVAAGEEETVRSIRRKFQDAMRSDITQAVENIIGRKARVLLSDHNAEHDIAIEAVVFEED
jgi:uncharacterized protein YbcI